MLGLALPVLVALTATLLPVRLLVLIALLVALLALAPLALLVLALLALVVALLAPGLTLILVSPGWISSSS